MPPWGTTQVVAPDAPAGAMAWPMP